MLILDFWFFQKGWSIYLLCLLFFVKCDLLDSEKFNMITGFSYLLYLTSAWFHYVVTQIYVFLLFNQSLLHHFLYLLIVIALCYFCRYRSAKLSRHSY